MSQKVMEARPSILPEITPAEQLSNGSFSENVEEDIWGKISSDFLEQSSH